MFKSLWTQHYPPRPAFTDANIPNQNGRNFLITGANSGIGFELAKLLYKTGATIYMAGRSGPRLREAINAIKTSQPSLENPAVLKVLHLDLADLESVKKAAADFASQESKLDILWNNAGLGGAPEGTSTTQNLEAHIGTNCVAPLLFTQLLLPQLRRAAEEAPTGSVRVVWSGSLMVDTFSPPGGIDFAMIESGKTTNSSVDYAVSKVGNWFLSVEVAKAWSAYNITSVVQNPGNLDTGAYRYQPWWLTTLLKWTLLYDAKYGAHTSLYSGFSEEVQNGDYIWPWGRKARSERKDIHAAIEKGASEKFWKWCEEKAKC